MAKFPLIEYIRNDGASVVVKLPDKVELFEFLEWMDVHFMGIDPAMIAMRRAEQVMIERQAMGKPNKVKRK